MIVSKPAEARLSPDVTSKFLDLAPDLSGFRVSIHFNFN